MDWKNPKMKYTNSMMELPRRGDWCSKPATGVLEVATEWQELAWISCEERVLSSGRLVSLLARLSPIQRSKIMPMRQMPLPQRPIARMVVGRYVSPKRPETNEPIA